MLMRIWEKVSKPPASALKRITGGRLNGMTDIKPQWRMQAITEIFGPCGIGWKYTIDKLWREDGSGEVFAFAMVSVYYKENDTWSEPLPGIGGSKLVAKESNGMHNNDEAYKMAVTDAISVALKSIGVAAEVYMGGWDGSKYRDNNEVTKPPVTGPVETVQKVFQDKPAQENGFAKIVSYVNTHNNVPSDKKVDIMIKAKDLRANPEALQQYLHELVEEYGE